MKNILIPIKTYLAEYGLKEFTWLILFFFILLPNSLVWSVQPGAEGSWHIGLNLALQKKLFFGEDYILTYGPFGFLCTKLAIVVSKWVILIFELVIIGCSLFIIRYFLKQSGYHVLCYILILLVAFLYLLTQYCSGTDPLMDLVIPIFLFAVFYFLNRQSFLAIVLAAIPAVFEFYFKVNYGIILILLLYAVLLFALYKKIVKPIPALMLSLAMITTIAVLDAVFHVALIPYIISSLHLINDFNDAMYMVISVSDVQFMLAVLIIALYATGFLISYKYYLANGIAFFCYLLGVIYLYLLFKNGFVRADAHIYTYFRNCTVIFGLIWAFEKGFIKKIWSVLTCLALAIYLIFFVQVYQNILSTNVQDYISLDYFKDIFTDVSYKNKLPDNTGYLWKIPPRFLDEIGHNTVDIIPLEISEMYYHNLNYDPRPIGQSYCAYDEYLDQKNCEKYISPTAPDYIVYALASIDHRYPFWDESMTTRALLTHYKMVDVDTIYVLLKKREKPLRMTVLKENHIKFEIGKEYKIDSSSNLDYLYADVKYTLWGKLKRFFFQPPPFYIIINYEDGRSVACQAIVPILKTGVLLNQKTGNIEFFNKPGFNPGKAISFRFDANRGFDSEIDAVIKEVKIEQ